MKIFRSPHPDIDLPQIDILTLLFDSSWCQAKEDNVIHVDAANPANGITKREARDLVKRVAHFLRHQYSIGASGPGEDVVLTVLHGSPFAPVLFYAIVAAGGIFSGSSTEANTDEIVRQVEDSGAKLIICSPEFALRGQRR